MDRASTVVARVVFIALSVALLGSSPCSAAEYNCSDGCNIKGPLVCGSDGNTYFGACLAHCQGITVVKAKGPCNANDRWLFEGTTGGIVSIGVINRFKADGFVYLGKGKAAANFNPTPPAKGSTAEPDGTARIIRFVFGTQDMYVATASAFAQAQAVTASVTAPVMAAAAAAATASTNTTSRASGPLWPAYNPANLRLPIGNDPNIVTAGSDDAMPGQTLITAESANATGRRLLQDTPVPSYPDITVGLIEYLDKASSCYGTLVGPASVLTAAHCVHGGGSRAAFTSGFNFSAAANGDNRPFGTVPAWYVTIYSTWMRMAKGSSSAAASNMAVVTLQQPVGYQVGWVPVASPGVTANTSAVESSNGQQGSPIWLQTADGPVIYGITVGANTVGANTAGQAVKLMTNTDFKTALASAASVTTRISLRGGRAGKFCTEDSDSVVRCNRDGVNDWERFTPEAVVQFNQFSYRGGRTGNYCTDDNDERMRCNRIQRNSWETFTVVTLVGAPSGFVPVPGVNLIVALQGGRGKKFCSDDFAAVICNRPSINQWERFTLTFLTL